MRWLAAILIALTACSTGATSSTQSSEAATAPSGSPAPETSATTEDPATTEPPATSVAPAVEGESGEGCADVIDATLTPNDAGGFTVAATVSSADTGWDKYADLWTVSVDGVVVGERVLTHPHETEQPFTRSLSGVVLPLGTTEVEIAARDSVSGFCGETFVVEVPS